MVGYTQVAYSKSILQSVSGRDCLMAAGYAFEELRPLMDKLPASDLATGGQAVALSQWHRVRFGHCLSQSSNQYHTPPAEWRAGSRSSWSLLGHSHGVEHG